MIHLIHANTQWTVDSGQNFQKSAPHISSYPVFPMPTSLAEIRYRIVKESDADSSLVFIHHVHMRRAPGCKVYYAQSPGGRQRLKRRCRQRRHSRRCSRLTPSPLMPVGSGYHCSEWRYARQHRQFQRWAPAPRILLSKFQNALRLLKLQSVYKLRSLSIQFSSHRLLR